MRSKRELSTPLEDDSMSVEEFIKKHPTVAHLSPFYDEDIEGESDEENLDNVLQVIDNHIEHTKNSISSYENQLIENIPVERYKRIKRSPKNVRSRSTDNLMKSKRRGLFNNRTANLECKVETDGIVNCSKNVYKDLKTWHANRLYIEDEIRQLKTKLEDLKEIRKHLKETRPEGATAAAENGEPNPPFDIFSSVNSNGKQGESSFDATENKEPISQPSSNNVINENSNFEPVGTVNNEFETAGVVNNTDSTSTEDPDKKSTESSRSQEDVPLLGKQPKRTNKPRNRTRDDLERHSSSEPTTQSRIGENSTDPWTTALKETSMDSSQLPTETASTERTQSRHHHSRINGRHRNHSHTENVNQQHPTTLASSTSERYPEAIPPSSANETDLYFDRQFNNALQNESRQSSDDEESTGNFTDLNNVQNRSQYSVTIRVIATDPSTSSSPAIFSTAEEEEERKFNPIEKADGNKIANALGPAKIDISTFKESQKKMSEGGYNAAAEGTDQIQERLQPFYIDNEDRHMCYCEQER